MADNLNIAETVFETALTHSLKYHGSATSIYCNDKFLASLDKQLGKDFDLEPIRLLIGKRGSDISFD